MAELAKIAFSDTRMALDWDGGFASLDDLAVRWFVYKLTTEAARGRDRKTGKTGPPLEGVQSEDKRQFPGGLTRTPIDLPCLSLDLSTARERLAVRLCLADARDPRRA